ncbi:MAG: YIP1 family protein [Symbiobacteriia bacterium]
MSVEEKELASAVSAANVVADSPRRHLWGDQPQDSAVAKFLDDLYGVLFSPRATFEDLAARPPLGMGLLLYLLILVVDAVAALPALAAVLGRFALGQLLQGATSVLMPSFLVLTALGWLVSAAFLHLVAEWLGGQGRATAFFTLGAFYRVPLLFLAPLALAASVTIPTLARPLGLLLWLWSLVLEILALRANYRFGTDRAILTLVLPVVVVAALALLLTVSTAMAAAPFLKSLIGG